ncbi:hypothetical protein CHISP_2662 [Chitinispirillum alkaliphilum]|nr:hypothetical protein CHISP_2662 [Chitinispirillum alkaliphilum]
MLKMLLAAFLLSLLPACGSCKPYKFISRLEGVREIKISYFENKYFITDTNEISRFFKNFMPANRRKNEFSCEKNFELEGVIFITFKDDRKPITIEYNLGKGYRVFLGSKYCYELFTYQLGRYMVEMVSE